MLKAESFEESIKRYKKNPILLKSHNYNKVKAIGKYTKEDGLVLFNNN